MSTASRARFCAAAALLVVTSCGGGGGGGGGAGGGGPAGPPVVYYSANDGASGFELWRTDGTEAGTVQVKDIYAGANSSYPADLTVFGGTLYFGAINTGTGANCGGRTAAGPAPCR